MQRRLVQIFILGIVAVLANQFTPQVLSFFNDDGLVTSLQAPDAQAATAVTRYSCQVASVHDGDSMRVRCNHSKGTVRIRLYQIDAPELSQAYGQESRKALLNMCPLNSRVQIHDYGTDTYDRILAYVSCQDKQGNTIENVNTEMIRKGAAWVYHHYKNDKKLSALEAEARSTRKGLWARDHVTSPREFRSR